MYTRVLWWIKWILNVIISIIWTSVQVLGRIQVLGYLSYVTLWRVVYAFYICYMHKHPQSNYKLHLRLYASLNVFGSSYSVSDIWKNRWVYSNYSDIKGYNTHTTTVQFQWSAYIRFYFMLRVWSITSVILVSFDYFNSRQFDHID